MTITLKVLGTSSEPPPGAGRRSALLEQLDALFEGIAPDVWVKVFDGDVAAATKLVGQLWSRAVQEHYTSRRSGGAVWVLHQPAKPKPRATQAGTVTIKVPPITGITTMPASSTPWSSLTPRQREDAVLEAHKRLGSPKQIAAELHVSEPTVYSYLKQLRTNGRL